MEVKQYQANKWQNRNREERMEKQKDEEKRNETGKLKMKTGVRERK